MSRGASQAAACTWLHAATGTAASISSRRAGLQSSRPSSQEAKQAASRAASHSPLFVSRSGSSMARVVSERSLQSVHSHRIFLRSQEWPVIFSKACGGGGKRGGGDRAQAGQGGQR